MYSPFVLPKNLRAGVDLSVTFRGLTGSITTFLGRRKWGRKMMGKSRETPYENPWKSRWIHQIWWRSMKNICKQKKRSRKLRVFFWQNHVLFSKALQKAERQATKNLGQFQQGCPGFWRSTGFQSRWIQKVSEGDELHQEWPARWELILSENRSGGLQLHGYRLKAWRLRIAAVFRQTVKQKTAKEHTFPQKKIWFVQWDSFRGISYRKLFEWFSAVLAAIPNSHDVWSTGSENCRILPLLGVAPSFNGLV